MRMYFIFSNYSGRVVLNIKFRMSTTGRPMSNLTQNLFRQNSSNAATMFVQSKLAEHVGSPEQRDIYAIYLTMNQNHTATKRKPMIWTRHFNLQVSVMVKNLYFLPTSRGRKPCSEI